MAERGATILITTHLMDETENCRIVGYIRTGRMLAEGSPEELKRLAGLRPILKLRVKDPEACPPSLAALGLEINVVGGELHVKIEEHGQIKEGLEQVVPFDLRLVEPYLRKPF